MKLRERFRDRYGSDSPVSRRMLRAVFDRTAYRVSQRYPHDLGDETVDTIKRVGPYSMTSPDRLAATTLATEYVARNGIPGALVECGVWKGGSMMAIAETLLRLGHGDRDLFLFDTFAGMPKPEQVDVTPDGRSAQPTWEGGQSENGNAWCGASLREVRTALLSTGYDPARLNFVEGKVEDTLPAKAPDQISVLRLDTDFYSSTRHELEQLYPRLVIGGVLILDDYGFWNGARRATDEYFEAQDIRIFLSRTDQTGRIAVKQAP